jgi:nitric-oxide synthase, bacterial
VRDRRQVTTAEQVAADAVAHLREATNGGRIRPTVTVLAASTPERDGRRSGTSGSSAMPATGYRTGPWSATRATPT